MSLYKKGQTWHYDFRFQGRRFHGSTGTTSKSKAIAVESAVRERARKEHFFGPERETLTLRIAFARYQTEVSDHRAVAENDFRAMSRLIDWFGPDAAMTDITDASVAAYVGERRGHLNQRGEPLSPSTVNRDTELMRRIWRRAAKVWKSKVPEIDWSAHLLKEPPGRIRELSEDEESRLFAALRPDFHALVYVALRMGIRVSGLRGLTWADVRLDKAELTYRAKGGRRNTLPIPTDVLSVIAGERGYHPVFVFTYECAKSRQDRRKGERYPFSLNGWRKEWGRALAAADIKDCRFHDLRHTALTRIVRETGNLRLAQAIAGHTSITTTTRYAHVAADDIRAGLERTARRKVEGVEKKNTG